MTTQNRELPAPAQQPSKEDYRELWIQAVEQFATNEELRSRIDFLEREIATNAMSSWTLH